MPKTMSVVSKRQKIKDSERTMFVWVAVMSIVVGFCLVITYFIFQQIAFKNRVISEKNTTVRTLKDNNAAVDSLRDNVRILETNSALRGARANDDEKALQVVLDALPADANPLALGGSLQSKLIGGTPGIELESLKVDPVETTLVSGDLVLGAPSEEEKTSRSVVATVIVRAEKVNPLKEMLSRFERSIRVIDVDTLSIERSEAAYTMTMQIQAYYEPAKLIELRDKVVKP
ncbi:hypothetical protein CR983_00485 [Candidatus Saccharibacteria bacterium]|nr:MAG: hypothetical protein CR983_00485 [Candidatus Saccharibacteria bacterium]